MCPLITNVTFPWTFCVPVIVDTSMSGDLVQWLEGALFYYNSQPYRVTKLKQLLLRTHSTFPWKLSLPSKSCESFQTIFELLVSADNCWLVLSDMLYNAYCGWLVYLVTMVELKWVELWFEDLCTQSKCNLCKLKVWMFGLIIKYDVVLFQWLPLSQVNSLESFSRSPL